jgi:hypothetical protein
LTRPNLVPLVLIPAVLVFSASDEGRLRRASVFAGAASSGVLLLMWAQQVLYGSPLAPGYGGIEQLFAFAHVRANLFRYLAWYAEAHTPAVLLAALAPVVLWSPPGPQSQAARNLQRQVVIALLGMSLAVYGAYLPYYPFADWPYLRFMLPALAPIYALTAGVAVRALDRLPAFARVPAFAVVLAMTAGIQGVQAYRKDFTEQWKWSRRVLMAGRYLDVVLPRNAVVITFFHSGSVRYYTGREILRPDLIPSAQVDDVLGRLALGGYRPYLLLDEELERAGLLARFPHTRLGALDWPPRASIGSHGRIVLYDLADRERHARGERWPIDTIR